jgi:GMP synthase-like glutamine amidotransferase
MRIRCLKHVAFEGPARIADWAQSRGHMLATTKLFHSQPLPAVEDFDWLVSLGGPMGVHDEAQYPWLTAEKQLIEQTVLAGKPVLGVCLGAQLLADVLGAGVYRNQQKEIGWFPVRRAPLAAVAETLRSLPAEFVPFHWHGDTFQLPAGALHMAESAGCRNQAFECGLAWGLQFHLEATPTSVEALIRNCAAEIGSGPYEQICDEMLRDPARFLALEPILDGLLDRMAATASPAPNDMVRCC